MNLSPYSLFTKVSFKGKGSLKEGTQVIKKEPFECLMTNQHETLEIHLHFQGHYNEPSYKLDVDLKELSDNNNMMTYLMVYNPFEGLWEFCVPL